MKLKKEFVTHMTGDTQIMVPVGKTSFRGMIRSNGTAAFIVDCLKEETTEEELRKKLLDKYDATEEQADKAVASVLATLRKVGALEE